ncbi:MAG: AraC family transcriptional regulator [Desulfobacterales bacterium]|nr:AraC family transcriptional regulator [Desulfobacterales bacterium]
MKNWKIEPKDSKTAEYIDLYWFLEKTQNDSSSKYPRMNPDPAGHLILSNPRRYYQYSNKSFSQSGHGNHLILPHCETITINHSQSFQIIGIKFKVGALYSLKIPTHNPILDQVINIDINTIFHPEALKETKILMQKIDKPEICRDMLDKLLGKVIISNVEDKHSKLIQKIIKLVPDIPLSEMASELNCSKRTIERSFLRVTGFTLKQYYTMQRLDAMLDYLYQLNKKDIKWAEIALQFGFSDQSHLIRYLKNSIGNTPGEYTKHRNLIVDAYGNFE